MSQAPRPPEISPNEVFARVERGDAVCLVDVRQPWEYENSHIPGALLLPLGELPDRFAAEIDPAQTVICLCEHGVRSRSAANFLAAQGYANVATMTGGMARYPGPVETGLPEKSSTESPA